MLEQLLGTVGSKLGELRNLGIGLLQNKFDKKYQIDMYNRQRQDALSDYNMQNEYNHPSSQMARLREAGINPVMAWKGGATDAVSVRSASPSTYQSRELPKSSNTEGFLAYQDATVKQAQVDNLRAQNTTEIQRALNIAADTASKLENTETTKYQRGLQQKLEANVLAKSSAEVNKMLADTELTNQTITRTKQATDIDLKDYKLREAMNRSNVKEAAERILQLQLQQKHEQLKMLQTRAQTFATEEASRKISYEIGNLSAQLNNLNKDFQLKQLEFQLRQKGLNPNDPTWLRAIIQALEHDRNKKP